MTQSNHPDQPLDLSAHRAARGQDGLPVSRTPVDAEAVEAPAEFEESPAVLRARNIERLREAVDAGDYRPDPGRIAESMLDNERS